MRPPFTAEEFLDVFRRYNDAVSPVQGVLLVLALLAIGAALRGSRRGARATLALLGLLWLWTAVAYHLAFFTTLGAVGYLFAAASAAEGLLLLRLSAAPLPPRFAPRADARGIAAALLLGYAVLGYPAAAALAGHHYPAMPTFGAPCPVTIFTLGLLLLSVDRPPRSALVVPIAWALVASSAVIAFGMWEDVGVPLAAIVAIALLGVTSSKGGALAADHARPIRASGHRATRAMRIVALVVATFVAGYLAYAAAAWLRYGQVSLAEARVPSTLDRYAPVYEVRERHETRVAAPAASAFATTCAFDLYDSRLVRAIFDAREIVMLRHRPPARAAEPFLHSVQAMGWGLLSASGDRELVYGAIAKPWEGSVSFRALPATEFAAFHEPGFAKIVWSIAVEPDGPTASRVRTETRVVTTDPASRARFRRYWALASPGIVLIRREALALVKREAEASHPVRPASTPGATGSVARAESP